MSTATARPRAAACAALVAASVVAAAPIAPQLPDTHPIRQALRLVNGESLLNVPFNFFQDLVNIPSTEIGAMQQLGDSLIFSGPWWAASATNIWGEDPGDPGHFLSVVDMALPFKALTGQGLGELEGFDGTDPQEISTADIADGHMGLSQQVALFMDAEIPVSASSDADWSAPLYPTTEITGSTFIDRNLWLFAMLTGVQKYPLFDNWFQVPTSDLSNGYTFDEANDPGIVDPSHGVGPNGSVVGDGVFLGTHPGPDGENLMPWANLDFKFDPGWALQHFWDSLEQTPNYSIGANGFDLPSLTEFGRALQTLVAGSIIAFDPNVPGSSTCEGGTCSIPAWATVPALVKDVENLWPGNTSIENWLTLASETGGSDGFGAANSATPHQVAVDNAYSASLQQWFDIGNPSLADPPSGVDTPITVPISQPMQDLIEFMKESGVQTFFADWAKLAGFQTVEYDSLTGDGLAASAASVAGSSDWWIQLLDDFGLSSVANLF